MKAVCWCGSGRVHVETVPDPRLLSPRDAIVKVSLAGICGCDLHLYDGYNPAMQEGDILGHEIVGRIAETGAAVQTLREGERVVVPYAIACGQCLQCRSQRFAMCDNSNPNAAMAESVYGHSVAGIFGSSHLFGGYAGGQAEYVRVPFADVGPVRIPDGVPDVQAVLLSEALPAAWQAAECCGIDAGDVVAVWGCGAIGLLAALCARLLGAERVLAIDRIEERLRLAETHAGAEPVRREEVDVLEELRLRTGGRGPDACIDAVGLEAHGAPHAIVDRVKHAMRPEADRPHVLREATLACRKGGTIVIAGTYGGFADRFPIGSVFTKGLTIRAVRTHAQRYVAPLLERVRSGEIDPSFIVSHEMSLIDAPRGYALFKHKEDHCVKVVLTP
jgi:threonine dehydrogenase-like Zn-dependent dehydrogenase